MNIDHQEIVAVLLRRWKFVVAVTAAVGLLAVVKELAFPPGYRAETVVMVTDLELGSAFDEEQPNVLADYIPEAFSPRVYGNLVGSPAVMGQVLEQLIEDGVFEGRSPDLDSFSQRLHAQVDEVDQTTRPITYSPLITLSAEASTEEEVKAIVDTWGEVAVEVSSLANRLLLAGADSSLERQKHAQREELEAVWAELEEERSQYDVEVLREELVRLADLGSDLKRDRTELLAEFEGAEESLNSIQANLEGEEQFVTLFHSPTDIAYFIAHELQRDRALDGNPIDEQGMMRQELNDAYWAQKLEEKTTLNRIADMGAQLSALDRERNNVRDEQNELTALLASHERKITRLETEEELAKQVYQQIGLSREMVKAASDIIHGRTDADIGALGLNRLTDRVYPELAPGVLGRRGRVMLAAVLAFLLGGAFVVGNDVVKPRLNELVKKGER